MKYLGQPDHIESGVKCPYCEHVLDDDDDLMPDSGEETEVTCPSCQKNFVGEKVISVDYRTYKNCESNADEHEYKTTTWAKDMEQCTKCPMIRSKVVA